MARRPSASQLAPKKILNAAELHNGIARLQKRIEDLEAFDPKKMTEKRPPELEGLSSAIKATLARIFGDGTADFQRFLPAADLQWTGPSFFMAGTPTPLSDYINAVGYNRERSLAQLRESVRTLQEDLAEIEGGASPNLPAIKQPPSRKVFIVHGHEGELREAVSGFLRKIDFTPVILHEQSNQGRTIVEKFEAHAEVDFAVVLLTPDDVGGPKGGAQQPRARQNVILELGYFIGKLGRQNVCAIKLGDLELPSDIIGVMWTPFDAHSAWKTALAKELRDAGHAIDWNKAMGP